jgi:hypothetical protein
MGKNRYEHLQSEAGQFGGVCRQFASHHASVADGEMLWQCWVGLGGAGGAGGDGAGGGGLGGIGAGVAPAAIAIANGQPAC